MDITDIKGTVKLSNGVKMPYLGLGVFLVKDGPEVIEAIQYAFEAGYRHIDTAAIYNNEKGVGIAIRNSNLTREEIFLTSKVWNSNQGYDNTLRAFDISLKKLETDYLDLYLVHWPVKGKYKDTWRALEQIYSEGRVKAIGVSNFLKHHLEDLLQETNVIPMVDQVEFHPYAVQQELLDFCKTNQIQFEAWSPLMQGKIYTIEAIKKIAIKYNKTIGQIVLRWDLQKGVITIPKSIHQEHIISNSKLFDFILSDEDIANIDKLDRQERVGAHPDHFNF
jgi:diketogulonate reductase-like aldo/keto reductase